MGFFKQLLDYVRHVLTLSQQLEETKQEVKELTRKVDELTNVMRDMAYDVRYALNDEKHEREKLALKLENDLLRSERRLPPPKDADK